MGRLLGARESRSGDPGGGWISPPPIPPFPGVDLFGGNNFAANPENALFLSTVWACITLIANTISTLPLETFRRTGTVPARITDPGLVLNPTSDMTQSEWLQMLLVSLLIHGNAYALKTGVSQLGYPLQLVLLDPKQVRVKVDRQTNAVQYLVGPAQTDQTALMWHVRGLTLPGRKVGLSPVGYAADTLLLDQAARKFAVDFFTHGGLPVSAITSDMEITQEQAATLKERFQIATRNREPVALGSGTKLEMYGVKPDESQFLETQQTNIARIAQFFNVPAELVGGKTGSSLTYNTVEMNNQTFLNQAISPWLRRVEDAFFALLPQPQFVQFNLSPLLRTDAFSQAKIDAIDIAAKVIAPSEKRTTRGLPPLTQPEKEELELVPLTINPGTGLPKALPNPPTPQTDDDVPVVGKPPPTVTPKVA